jgi:hypothetical protein
MNRKMLSVCFLTFMATFIITARPAHSLGYGRVSSQFIAAGLPAVHNPSLYNSTPVEMNDSVITINHKYPDYSTKYVLGYNESAHLQSGVLYTSRNGEWVMAGKMLGRYDDNGRVIERIKYTATESGWLEYEKNEWAYTPFDSISMENISNWENNSWVEEERTEYQYNNNHKLLIKHQYGSVPAVIFQPGRLLEFKTEYVYDDMNRLLSHSEFDLYDSGWKNKRRSTMSYNESGSLVDSLYFHWNDIESTWDERDRRVFTYNADGSLASWLHTNYSLPAEPYKQTFDYSEDGAVLSTSRFIMAGDEWELYGRTDYTYNFTGERLSETIHSTQNGTVRSSSKSEYEYDSYGNRISYKWYSSVDGVLQLQSSEEREFEGAVALGDVAMGFLPSHSLVRREFWSWTFFSDTYKDKSKPLSLNVFRRDTIENDMKLSEETSYFYSVFQPTGIQANLNNSTGTSFSIALNNSKIRFSRPMPVNTAVSIFNLSGKKVYADFVEGSYITLPVFSSGVYLIKVNPGNRMFINDNHKDTSTLTPKIFTVGIFDD